MLLSKVTYIEGFFFVLIVCNVIDFSLLTYFKCYCGLIKISLMLREVKKERDRDIDLQ